MMTTQNKEWRETDEITQIKLVSPKETILNTINEYPPPLQHLLKHIEQPNNKFKEILTQIKDGKLIGSCDGSLLTHQHQKYGGHSYVLQGYDHSRNRCQGWGCTPSSDTITSTTTEHYGLITILVVLQAVQDIYQIKRQRCPVDIWIVNEETVKRANNTDVPINISETMVPDYDL